VTTSSFSISTISFRNGPYLPTNTSGTTLQPAATSGTTTVTASSALFASTDVGRVLRIQNGATWGWARITGYTSSTVVTVSVGGAFASTSATTTWRLGVWSDTTGWPSCSTFHEDRLVFAGPTDNPQRIDGSNTGDYEGFGPSAADGTIGAANSYAINLSSNDVNAIRWLSSDEHGLLVGTSAGEWILRASNLNEALSPTNAKAVQASRFGSANVDSTAARKATIFVQASGRKVYDLTYQYTIDGLDPEDLTELSEHITRPSILDMCFQQEPFSVVWGARSDGALVGLTYNRKVDSLRAGWHRHTIGGYSDAGRTTAAKVESVCVIPSPDGTYDELWMVVQRYVNGGTKRYIEYMERVFDDSVTQANACFLDASLTYTGAPATSFTGATHLKGETVGVYADGAQLPDVTVDGSGNFTISRAASTVTIGAKYTMDGAMQRIEAGAADGTALGKTRRVHRVAFLLYRSLGLKVGRDFSNLKPLQFNAITDAMGVAPALFSGIKADSFNGDYDYDGYICWRQDQPHPSNILAVMPQMETQDRG
jgi:hypothetical protein